MTYLHVREERDRLVVEIRRPERGNALGTTLAGEMLAALDQARNALHKSRVLVIKATPVIKGARRTWIAGGDLKELAQLASQDEAAAYARALSSFRRGLDELPVPVVVAIDGAAIGGGAELALCGDLRLATAASSFEFKQLKVGLATGYGTARRLVELVGLARAQDLLYRCRTLTAAEALALGLLSEVVPDEVALEQAVDAVCRELAALGPEGLAAQKRMLRDAVSLHPGAAAEAEIATFAAIWRNPAHARFLDDFAAGASPAKGGPGRS